MEIKLTPEQETLIARKLESSEYCSANEVVRDSFRLLEAYGDEYQARLSELRAEIQKGIDSGPGIPAEEVRKHMRAFIAGNAKGWAWKRA